MQKNKSPYTTHKDLLNILSPLLRLLRKKFPFKTWLLIDNATGHSRALMEMFSETNVVFMPANTTSLLKPIDQRVVLTSMFYYVRNRFYKTTAVTDSDSFYGWNKLKIFWNGLIIFGSHQEHLWFLGRSKNFNMNRSLEEVDSNHHGWF